MPLINDDLQAELNEMYRMGPKRAKKKRKRVAAKTVADEEANGQPAAKRVKTSERKAKTAAKDETTVMKDIRQAMKAVEVSKKELKKNKERLKALQAKLKRAKNVTKAAVAEQQKHVKVAAKPAGKKSSLKKSPTKTRKQVTIQAASARRPPIVKGITAFELQEHYTKDELRMWVEKQGFDNDCCQRRHSMLSYDIARYLQSGEKPVPRSAVPQVTPPPRKPRRAGRSAAGKGAGKQRPEEPGAAEEHEEEADDVGAEEVEEAEAEAEAEGHDADPATAPDDDDDDDHAEAPAPDAAREDEEDVIDEDLGADVNAMIDDEINAELEGR